MANKKGNKPFSRKANRTENTGQCTKTYCSLFYRNSRSVDTRGTHHL